METLENYVDGPGRPDSGAQAVAHDGQQIAGRGVAGVCGRLARRPDERDHRRGRHVGAHGADGLRSLQEHADGVAQAILYLRRRLLEFEPGAHDGDEQVALGCALLHDVGQEAEERVGRVVGVRQRPGSAVSAVRRSSRMASQSFSLVGKWR